MTVGMVPGASIAGMVFSLIVSFALPIGLFIYAKKKLGAKAAPFFIGCGAAQGACQRAGGLLPILHNKYLHLDPLRITARCPGRSTRLPL